MKQRKPLKVHGAPVLNENFNPVVVTRAQAESLARNKAREFERKSNAYSGAIGCVYESETHYCINVGWKVKGMN